MYHMTIFRNLNIFLGRKGEVEKKSIYSGRIYFQVIKLQNIVYIINKRRTNCATAVSVSCAQVEETIVEHSSWTKGETIIIINVKTLKILYVEVVQSREYHGLKHNL